MRFEDLLKIVGKVPVFSSTLVADQTDSPDIHRQLVRWRDAGKIIQIRRSLYSLAEPYRMSEPHTFFIACQIKPDSYISLQSALAFHGIAGEPKEVQSITIRNPKLITTPLGTFRFRQIKKNLYGGYVTVDVGEGQQVNVAGPEKALLDLLYLYPYSDNPETWKRLDILDFGLLSEDRLRKLVFDSESDKLRRAAGRFYLRIRASQV